MPSQAAYEAKIRAQEVQIQQLKDETRDLRQKKDSATAMLTLRGRRILAAIRILNNLSEDVATDEGREKEGLKKK